jgi:hypothetical protein
MNRVLVFIVLEPDDGAAAVDGVYFAESAANARRDELINRTDDPGAASVVAKYVSTRGCYLPGQ